MDALIWSPGHIDEAVAAGVRKHFTHDQAVELTFGAMRNVSNKITVALGGDAQLATPS